jgi:hypothetical protein
VFQLFQLAVRKRLQKLWSERRGLNLLPERRFGPAASLPDQLEQGGGIAARDGVVIPTAGEGFQ